MFYEITNLDYPFQEKLLRARLGWIASDRQSGSAAGKVKGKNYSWKDERPRWVATSNYQSLNQGLIEVKLQNQKSALCSGQEYFAGWLRPQGSQPVISLDMNDYRRFFAEMGVETLHFLTSRRGFFLKAPASESQPVMRKFCDYSGFRPAAEYGVLTNFHLRQKLELPVAEKVRSGTLSSATEWQDWIE